MYVLDTDHLSVLQGREMPAVNRLASRMALLDRDRFFVTVVSYHEQVIGWHAYLLRSRVAADTVRGYRMLERTLLDFTGWQMLSFDDAAGDCFNQLVKRNLRINTMDLRIAAIAMVNRMTLLSRNTKDFSRIDGLKLEDWTTIPRQSGE